MESWIQSPVAFGVIGLVIAAFFYFGVKALPSGNDAMNRIASYIREGSMAFLTRQYKVLVVYVAVVFAISYGLGMISGVTFALGAFLSLLAGFFSIEGCDLRER